MNLKKRTDVDEQDVKPLEEKPRTRKQSQESVIVYLIVLFSAVFLLILISYFMHQRQNEAAISDLTDEHAEYRLKAEENMQTLLDENQRLRAELDAANAKIKELEQNTGNEVKTND